MAAGPLGAEGAPQTPFVFQQEEEGGTTPKLLVQDNERRVWSVKWGEEVHAEVFATRLLWAVGYIVEPSYFVRSGKIDSVGSLSRASAYIDRANDNAFSNARLELRALNVFPVAKSWNWNENPFAGTRQLQGLKIMIMLVSNWDPKDGRDKGGNTGILRVQQQDGTEELQYLITDWGASMGRWGGVATREKWNCKDFAGQTKNFVKGVENGMVKFGYAGKRVSDIAAGISSEDVRWLMQYLGRVTDAQLQDALTASGATQSETLCFTSALRNRIEQLRRAAGVGVISQR